MGAGHALSHAADAAELLLDEAVLAPALAGAVFLEELGHTLYWAAVHDLRQGAVGLLLALLLFAPLLLIGLRLSLGFGVQVIYQGPRVGG